MKNLHRPIPKSKILEGLKKCSEIDSLLSTSNGIINSSIISPNVSQKALIKKSTPSKITTKFSQTRTSIGKIKSDEKPKNTIRLLFQRQLEKSSIESSQLTANAVNENATQIIDSNDMVAEPLKNNTKMDEETNDSCLVTGSLHKRLTRRNSITLQTPTKKPDMQVASILSSTKKRRCTMFTPSKPSIEEAEEDEIQIDRNKTVVDKSTTAGNKTVNITMAMEICNEPKKDEAKKCNSRVRELLNSELSKTPSNKVANGAANKFLQSTTSLRRRTTYTPLEMEKTQIQTNASTPISSTQRRKTMNLSANTTPLSAVKRLPDAFIETKSCNAVLTPINNKTTGPNQNLSL